MIGRVVKTTFEEEQKQKDEAFLKFSPIERLVFARKVRDRMKRPDVIYSFSGQVVKVQKA
jgi:hypothetical protein